MPKKNKKVALSVTIDPVVYLAAASIAKEETRSLSNYIETALKEANKKRSKSLHIAV